MSEPLTVESLRKVWEELNHDYKPVVYVVPPREYDWLVREGAIDPGNGTWLRAPEFMPNDTAYKMDPTVLMLNTYIRPGIFEIEPMSRWARFKYWLKMRYLIMKLKWQMVKIRWTA